MSTDFVKIREIASASLLPDFFAVRIEEEGLFAQLQQLLGKLKFAKPVPQLDRIRQIAQASSDATAFVESIKSQELWPMLREILSKLQVK